MGCCIGALSFNPHNSSVPGAVIIPSLQMRRPTVMLIMKVVSWSVPSCSAPSPAEPHDPPGVRTGVPWGS